MNFLHKYRIRPLAQAGQEAEDIITAELGPRPNFDPVANPEHGQIAHRLATLPTEREELTEDLNRTEDALTQQPSLMGLNVGLLFLFFVEALGSIMVMASLGFGNPERWILGLMLACLLFFLTWLATRSATVSGSSRAWWFYLVLAVYAVLVLALTLIRVAEMADEESGSSLLDLAAGIVMVAATVGPAWLAEWVIRQRGPAVRLAKVCRQQRNRLRRAVRQHRRAQSYMDKLARRTSRWEREVAKWRAYINLNRNSDQRRNDDDE